MRFIRQIAAHSSTPYKLMKVAYAPGLITSRECRYIKYICRNIVTISMSDDITSIARNKGKAISSK